MLCENVTTDNNGRSSLTHIFDVVITTNLPAIPQAFKIAFNVALSPEDFQGNTVNFRISITDPKKKKLLDTKGQATIVGKPKNIATYLDLSGRIAFPIAGVHVIELFINDELVAMDKFNVTLQAMED